MRSRSQVHRRVLPSHQTTIRNVCWINPFPMSWDPPPLISCLFAAVDYFFCPHRVCCSHVCLLLCQGHFLDGILTQFLSHNMLLPVSVPHDSGWQYLLGRCTVQWKPALQGQGLQLPVCQASCEGWRHEAGARCAASRILTLFRYSVMPVYEVFPPRYCSCILLCMSFLFSLYMHV